MTRTIQVWGTMALLLLTMAYALAEDITLTTYYPSPRGVYKELQVTDLILNPPGNLTVPGSLAVGPGATVGSPGEAAFTGHVGIGTTAAGEAQLEIKGSPNATTPLLALTADPTHQADLAVFTASNGSAFTITAEGNIGFGTDSPTDLNGVAKPSGSAAPGRTLQIDAGPDEEASLLLTSTRGGSAVGAGMIVINPQAGLPRIKMGGRTAGAPLLLINEGQERLRIVPGGNIGIGTTTPVAALDVNGGVRVGTVPDPACVPATAGTLRYNNSLNMTQYCNGSVWQPSPALTPTFFTVGGNNPAFPLGVHDACLSAGMQLWDSAKDHGIERCRIYRDVTSGAWLVDAQSDKDPGALACYVVCLN